MNCTALEQFILMGFVLSLVAANIASWRVEKSAVLEGYKGPKWKLLLGDVALPKSVLTDAGKRWRKASIILFVLLVFFGISIGVSNLGGSECFGLNG
jgi:type II secretory pathway component PulL